MFFCRLQVRSVISSCSSNLTSIVSHSNADDFRPVISLSRSLSIEHSSRQPPQHRILSRSTHPRNLKSLALVVASAPYPAIIAPLRLALNVMSTTKASQVADSTRKRMR